PARPRVARAPGDGGRTRSGAGEAWRAGSGAAGGRRGRDPSGRVGRTGRPREEVALPLRTKMVSGLGGALLTSLMRTTRFERSGTEHYDAWIGSGRTAIYVLWHGRLLPCSYYHRDQGLATLISRHR